MLITADNLLKYMMRTPPEDRGLNVYHMSELRSVSARAGGGELLNVPYQNHLFTLSVEERVQIARFSAMVFGVIAGRKNRIASLDWSVVPITRELDQTAGRLDELHSIYTEYEDLADDTRYAVLRASIAKHLKSHMKDLRPDLGNFKAAFQRWRKASKRISEDRAGEIEEWLKNPNPDYTFEDYLKLWVDDLHTHGAHAMYKESQGGRVENFYALPGGTTIPVHNRTVGGMTAYVQISGALIEPQVYFQNEVLFSRWLPSTAMSYGLVPLEALVNKVAEQMLFDALAAEQADGTVPPEKVVAISNKSPFGDPDDDMDVPMSSDEQKKVETVLNEKRKQAVRTLSGYGDISVLDLSKSDTFQHQSDRQRQLKEDVALVFGATNMEVNLTGSGDTSGRATSESQERMEQKRGIQPILRLITQKINEELLPYRCGPGYRFHFSSGLSEGEQWDLWIKKAKSGVVSVNEIRTGDIGTDPYPEEHFDRPAQQQQPQPGEDAANPFFTSPME